MGRRRHAISVEALFRPRPAVTSDDVRVTDHALVRWLERVHGIDVEYFRNEIRSIAGPAAASGAKALRRDGHVYLFDAGAIVTVVPDDRR